jgi:nitrogen fixation-related uncharacterized protein
VILTISLLIGFAVSVFTMAVALVIFAVAAEQADDSSRFPNSR